LTSDEISRIYARAGVDKGGNWVRDTAIQGNIIGLMPDGISAGAIAGNGITIYDSSSNTIGGKTQGSGNLIGRVRRDRDVG